ncbi:type I pantothenate kinase [Candidatus Pantoea edessiphila]|uniref:Pantothenate kinase n=1 Tax=Candidatus Pantoea edessiphila TaxID=2044610 RepID=A0A2P5T142_9GAMM|nr:type I pantothenate kinase [Candidatus Pantoea edessiphila]PPI88314.1 type I pantothenate kinase [Candidatus Pantoea edessiphila]
MTNLYLVFNREEWANLGHSIPLHLSNEQFGKLKNINSGLSINEITEIYLPLLYLLNYFIKSNNYHHKIIGNFLGNKIKKIPYIIGISGGVAVGKSTIANLLQVLLKQWYTKNNVELITTDSFLYPNKILIKKGLMEKKGFPQSYDVCRLIKFLSDLKSGVEVISPIYSHIIYDIVPKKNKIIKQPDILIIEGLNLLQSTPKYSFGSQIFISDFINCSIYVDAVEALLKNWYISRFLKFRENAFTYSNSYFHNYINISKKETIKIAKNFWQKINGLNLKENILPTKRRANIILTKTKDHSINLVSLRK